MSTLSKPKEVSSCCGARAKINAIGGYPGYMHFCCSCGQPCGVKKEKPKYSTLSMVRKVTGEKEIFERLYVERAHGVSEVSGLPLLPPGHRHFTWQGSHLLCTNNYPDYQLREDNIVMVTIDEHDYWTNQPALCRQDPAWKEVWARYDKLKLEAETK